MSLFEQIKADQLQVRKEKNALAASLLTTLIGEITRDAAQSDTSDTAVIAVVKKFIKGMDETIKNLGDSNAEGTATVKAEKTIMENYLPKQMTAEELKDAIMKGFITSFNKGTIMKHLKEFYSGQYDGKVAAQVIDDLLGTK